MRSGWFKFYRQIFDNPICTKDSEYFFVWCYILSEATYEEESVLFKNEEIFLAKGQFLTTVKDIALKLKLSESKVNRILKKLEIEKQIEKQSSSKNTLITVLNWERYQSSEEQNEEQMKNERQTSDKPVKNKRQTDGKPSYYNKNIRIEEDKKERKEEIKNNKYYCPEPEQLAIGQQPVIEIILNDKTFYPIFQSDIDEWKELYPAVNVIQELRKMKDWSNSNTQKRKTRKGIRRFISNWLSKAQDRSSSSTGKSAYLDAIHNRVSEVDNWV